MAQPVPYSYTQVRVPPGFGVILEDLAREVLRDQPKDIPSYAAQHFNALLKARDESGEDPVEWAARLESRFNNKLSSKKPSPGPAAAQSRLVAEPLTSPDHAGHKEPSEDIQPSSEAITLSPLASDQEVALDSAADTGAETADETTEPPAEAQYGRMADVDICAQELQGSGLGESKMGGETEEEKGEDIDENVEEVVEAGVGHGEEEKEEEEKGRIDEEGEEAGKKGEEFEEETREEEEEVNKASKPDEEEATKGDEEIEEPGVGGREEEEEEETEEGKGEYNVDEARHRDEAQVEVEKVSSSAHTDADNICKAELEPSPEAPIGGLANVDVCAAELHGQPLDQDPVSEASIKEVSSPQASESQIEEKELSASQEEMESSDIKAESPEHSQTPAMDDGSEVTAQQRTYFEGQYEEEPEQETSAISDVSQEHRSEQEEPEAEAKISGSADADGEPGPGGTDGKVGLCDDGEGKRSQGDGDGEHRHGDDDVEQHTHGDGEPGLVETDWEGQASRTETDEVSGYDELAPEDMSKEEEEENVCPASDSHVEDTDTDKPEGYEELSQPEEKSEGHVSTSRAEGDHGDDHTAEITQRDREEGEIVEEEEEGDKDNEVSETDKDVHKSTLQDASEIESTQRDGSDDEGDATQATDQLDEQALISEQTYSSATHTRSAGEERDSDMEEGSVESVKQPGSREPSDEKPDGEGKEPEKGSSEKPEVESSPEVSHSSEQEASEGVRDAENKQQEAVSEELDEGKNTGKQEGEVERDQSLQEEGVVGETECTSEGSPEQSLSDPAGSEPAAAETAEKHSAEPDYRTQTPNPEQDESREHSQDQSEYAEERGAGEESCDDKSDSKEECNQPGDEEDIMDIPLDDPEANRAAAKIQAGFRGHMTRKKMPRKEGEKGDEVSSSGEALNGNQGNTGASEEAESEGTSAPEQ